MSREGDSATSLGSLFRPSSEHLVLTSLQFSEGASRDAICTSERAYKIRVRGL